MKFNYKKSLACVAAAVLLFNVGCEDFSFKSKTSRLVGEWELVDQKGGNELFEGEDELEFEFEFEDDGDCEMTMKYDGDTYSFDGSWEWSNDEEKIIMELDFDGDEVELEFDLIKLTDDELWVESALEGEEDEVAELEFAKK